MDNENNQAQEQEEVTGIKISEFPAASTLSESDTVTGLQAGGNVRFTMSSILSWIAQRLSNAFVSASRTINGKSLSSDVTLTASDVGARPDTWTPSAADIGAQEEITASGILKGDGQGGITAATAGTDYGTYSKPSGGIPASDLASGVIPTVPSAYTSNPAMDGTASPGSSGAWAKGDHVHPTDSTKAAKADLTNIQATGTTNTTGAAIPAGAYFYLNGILYQAKTQIDVNATFTVNTNCEQVTAGGLNNLVSELYYPFNESIHLAKNYGTTAARLVNSVSLQMENTKFAPSSSFTVTSCSLTITNVNGTQVYQGSGTAAISAQGALIRATITLGSSPLVRGAFYGVSCDINGYFT